MSIDDRAVDALEVLLVLTSATDARVGEFVHVDSLAGLADRQHADIVRTLDGLATEGLVRITHGGAPAAALTSAGLDRVTALTAESGDGNRPRPSEGNTFTIGGHVYGNVQHGTQHSRADSSRPRARRSRRDNLVVGALVSFLVAVAAGIAVVVLTRGNTTQEPLRPSDLGETVQIDNRVTSGESVMVEDSPAYLSSETRSRCELTDCRVGDADFQSGDYLGGVVCQENGDVVTNGDRTTPADDDNPGLFESDRWYGIRLNDGTLAYISEVWLADGDRGGLGLPNCSTTQT